jgi:integrase
MLSFSFLYNTGARIQEALDVCPQAIRFEPPTCGCLYGNGRKERLCPLWPETVSLLRLLLQRQREPTTNDLRQSLLCPARIGCPLQTDGICRGSCRDHAEPGLEARHAAQLPTCDGSASGRSGVDITVIRSWLGHVSLDTTNHYAQANLETKRKALESLENPSSPSKQPSWKEDKSVLAWLDML